MAGVATSQPSTEAQPADGASGQAAHGKETSRGDGQATEMERRARLRELWALVDQEMAREFECDVESDGVGVGAMWSPVEELELDERNREARKRCRVAAAPGGEPPGTLRQPHGASGWDGGYAESAARVAVLRASAKANGQALPI